MAGKEETIASIRSFLVKYKNIFLVVWLVLSVILIILGAALLNSTNTTIYTYRYDIDYTQCKALDPNRDTTCQDFFKENDEISCICYRVFDLNLKGNVTLSYEFPDFDQTSTNYTTSKDDEQLKGILRNTPSDNCKPYQYDNGKPIAPCGAIADSMLFDNVRILEQIVEDTIIKVPLLRHGMLSAVDKVGFHNPQNLTQALQNFTKPMHWPKNIYELDSENENNNGFQNEYFISWMRTDWKRKPIARVNHIADIRFNEGLPNATYQARIQYYRSPSGYEGSRVLVFTSEVVTVIPAPYASAVVLLIFGVLMLAACALPYAYILFAKYSDSKQRNERDRSRQKVDEASPELLRRTNN